MTDSRAELEGRRLGWAGVSIGCEGRTLLIDPLASPELWGGARWALVTHLHSDHFDEPTLRRLLGERGEIVCSEKVAGTIVSHGFRAGDARIVHCGDTLRHEHRWDIRRYRRGPTEGSLADSGTYGRAVERW